MTIPYIKDEQIEAIGNFPDLIQSLEDAFYQEAVLVPLRHHHDYPNPLEKKDSTLLLMPAFDPGNAMGVKIVTVSPNNGKYDMPSIQGTYLYFDAHKGNIKALFDAKMLTAKRTAAASALASSYLSRKDASSLLMVGTGALSIQLIKAHTSVRPIEKVYVWGRNFEKAKEVCQHFTQANFSCEPIEAIESHVKEVAIISCATLSEMPLVLGQWLQSGQHLDLVGAYKKDMREADDEAISKSSVYVDTFQGGLKESGDIVIPLEKGILKKEEIIADLFGMAKDTTKRRKSSQEITLFKSVGHAIEDLAAATYYYNLLETEQ